MSWVLKSTDILLAWLFLHELDFFFFNTGIYLVTPAILHYIFDMEHFIFCIPFSSALAITIRYFLAWVKQRAPAQIMVHKLPKRGFSNIGNPCRFLTGKSYHKRKLWESVIPSVTELLGSREASGRNIWQIWDSMSCCLWGVEQIG